jgi:hypothetical protein
MPALKMEVELFSETLLRNSKTTRYPNMEDTVCNIPVGLRFRHACICYDSKLKAMTSEWKKHRNVHITCCKIGSWICIM